MSGHPVEAHHRLRQADLDAWADLSGDHNPLHNDPAYAAGTAFGATIAHGHLVLTWLTAAAADLRRDAGLPGSAIVGLRFRSPVHTDRDYRVTATPAAPGRAELRVADAVDGRTAAEAMLEWDPDPDPARTEGG